MGRLRHTIPPATRRPPGADGPFGVLDLKLYLRGKDIFREGDPGHNAYLVEAGMVEIWKALGDRRVVLGHVGPGGVFGEMALIDETPRMATATALGSTTCVVIPDAMLSRKLASADPFVRALVRILMRNVRSLTRDKMVCAATDDDTVPHLID
ncbi:MAG: cyclic nucleotide-binding domain-containing protein [Alphaproteobacteria bacterium]|nr:cyclic nucleotide-binding domain-containing protein [Alphaproteobacteria bacterium]